VTRLQRAGLPHSETHGSQPACGSPWLIAAYHVLHRLLMPRHPPCALHILSLIILPVPFFGPRPPRIAPRGTRSRYDQRTASATHIAPAVILTLDTLGAPSRLRARPAAFTTRPAPPRDGFILTQTTPGRKAVRDCHTYGVACALRNLPSCQRTFLTRSTPLRVVLRVPQFGSQHRETTRTAMSHRQGVSQIKKSGVSRIRTGDPLLAKQVLYQLSYNPAR
jgi:hypothetical protein